MFTQTTRPAEFRFKVGDAEIHVEGGSEDGRFTIAKQFTDFLERREDRELRERQRQLVAELGAVEGRLKELDELKSARARGGEHDA